MASLLAVDVQALVVGYFTVVTSSYVPLVARTCTSSPPDPKIAYMFIGEQSRVLSGM